MITWCGFVGSLRVVKKRFKLATRLPIRIASLEHLLHRIDVRAGRMPRLSIQTQGLVLDMEDGLGLARN